MLQAIPDDESVSFPAQFNVAATNGTVQIPYRYDFLLIGCGIRSSCLISREVGAAHRADCSILYLS